MGTAAVEDHPGQRRDPHRHLICGQGRCAHPAEHERPESERAPLENILRSQRQPLAEETADGRDHRKIPRQRATVATASARHTGVGEHPHGQRRRMNPAGRKRRPAGPRQAEGGESRMAEDETPCEEGIEDDRQDHEPEHRPGAVDGFGHLPEDDGKNRTGHRPGNEEKIAPGGAGDSGGLPQMLEQRHHTAE